MLKIDPNDKAKLIDPLFVTTPRFWIAAFALSAIVAWGLFMYARQLIFGLGETGMNRPVYWGVYMVNFIFFIGISHAGTLISAILRVTGAEWRRPITRVAEAITAFALIVGSLQIIIDMGRPDRLIFVMLYGRLQSPILWDVVSVTTYFLGSITYLYLPLIPDAAILRDNCPPRAPAWQRLLYTVLAIGWRGTREQWIRLEKAIAFMAVFHHSGGGVSSHDHLVDFGDDGATRLALLNLRSLFCCRRDLLRHRRVVHRHDRRAKSFEIRKLHHRTAIWQFRFTVRHNERHLGLLHLRRAIEYRRRSRVGRDAHLSRQVMG